MMKKEANEAIEPIDGNDGGASTEISKSMALTIDYSLYEKHLENSGLSDNEKREFIDTLWNVIVNFVDLGFDVHPLQQACGQKLDISQLDPAAVLNLSDTLHSDVFSKAANNAAEEIKQGESQ